MRFLVRFPSCGHFTRRPWGRGLIVTPLDPTSVAAMRAAVFTDEPPGFTGTTPLERAPPAGDAMDDPGPSSPAAPDPSPPVPGEEGDRWVLVPATDVDGADAPKVFHWEDLQQELARLWSLSATLASARVRTASLAARLDSALEVLYSWIRILPTFAYTRILGPGTRSYHSFFSLPLVLLQSDKNRNSHKPSPATASIASRGLILDTSHSDCRCQCTGKKVVPSAGQ
jgi:hypothetical protein